MHFDTFDDKSDRLEMDGTLIMTWTNYHHVPSLRLGTTLVYVWALKWICTNKHWGLSSFFMVYDAVVLTLFLFSVFNSICRKKQPIVRTLHTMWLVSNMLALTSVSKMPFVEVHLTVINIMPVESMTKFVSIKEDWKTGMTNQHVFVFCFCFFPDSHYLDRDSAIPARESFGTHVTTFW